MGTVLNDYEKGARFEIKYFFPVIRTTYLAFCKFATLYVPDSDVENYKKIYQGTVLPISSSEEALGISDVTPSSTMSADSYDLQGRPVKGEAKRGIYVKEGRKVIK